MNCSTACSIETRKFRIDYPLSNVINRTFASWAIVSQPVLYSISSILSLASYHDLPILTYPPAWMLITTIAIESFLELLPSNTSVILHGLF